MNLLSRKEAKAQGAYLYFTGNPCKYGHVAERYTNNTLCTVCAKKYTKEYTEPFEVRKARYERNKEHNLANKKRYYSENRESIREKQQAYCEANKDKLRVMGKRWRDNNPERVKENVVNYRYRKYRAIPNWLTENDKQKIRDIYKRCKELTMQTGIQHHVDHIIPIAGKVISGLHIPENLQILTASENCPKRNNFNAGTLTIQEAE